MALSQKHTGKMRVPWYNSQEWKQVKNAIFGPYSTRSDKEQALETILLWKIRTPQLPGGVEGTLTILDTLLTNEDAFDSRLIRQLYGSALTRFLNLCAASGDKQGTLYKAAKQNHIPDWIVDKMSDSNDESINGTPPDIRSAANETYDTLLPKKSRSKYEFTYKKFMEWTLVNNIHIISENVVTAYMTKLSKEIKPSTLWTTYSMLRSMLNIKNNIDISTYCKLKSFLKLQSSGYKTKKSKILTSEQIKKFLLEAPDKEFLLTKTILIFGISGGCRRQELRNLKINHIRDLKNELQDKLVDTKTKTDRSFVIPGWFYEISKKYMELRPPDMEQFFLNYQNGKCFKQVVGINKMGNQPTIIAKFLKLPNPELFTGHCFRRSGATILADAGGDTLTVKNFGGWKSTPVMETYIENSLSKKENIGNTIVQSIQDIQTKNIASTSRKNIAPSIMTSNYKYNSVTENNNYADIEKEAITYNNCTFNNCTFITKNK